MRDYQKTKENYDKGVDWHIQKSLSYDWSKQIERFLKKISGKRILDVGCGGGRDIASFLKKGVEVEGVDYSHKTILRCRKQFSKVKFFEGDMRDMRFLKNSYDGIWACASLLNLEKKDVPFALAEFKRLLKKSGLLFISVKEGDTEGVVRDQAGERFFSFYTMDELASVVDRAGFKVVHREKVSDGLLTGTSTEPKKPDWICIYAVLRA
ncbi:class I SAM-dependent methyltransferase [Candidatus Woesearchaeota archaeon]|nr:MAG: class I SAM-dependent methyltransferase [Candidatus Woesearchaeota archaeon]